MIETRNPFRLLAAEHIHAEDEFLRLFAPRSLEVLPAQEEWERPVVLRSAPGGGKTSLLRLFTPPVLRKLFALKNDQECKDLYGEMKRLGAFDEKGPRMLGVMVSCARSFAAIDDLSEIDAARRDRLFNALLDARLVLGALRGALLLAGRQPEAVNEIEVDVDPSLLPQGIPTRGPELREWAMSTERAVAEAINTLEADPDHVPGWERPVAPELLRPGAVQVRGTPVADRVLFLLDDGHKLVQRQRERLLENAIASRAKVGVWFAERSEAVADPAEVLSAGALVGRDYREIELDSEWRDRHAAFRKLALNVAERRARHADPTIQFETALRTTIEGRDDDFDRALRATRERVYQTVKARPQYALWVAERESDTSPPRERAIAWRKLEILIERDIRKAQQSWLQDPIGVDVLAEEDADGKAEKAAELFVALDTGAPYYYGPGPLAQLASGNIEQFLALAADQFDQMRAAVIMRRTAEVSPEVQERLIVEAAERRWDEIPRRVRQGRAVQNLLSALGDFARKITYVPNAPYAPGVTGIGLLMSDLQELREHVAARREPYWTLGRVVSSAAQHNLLELEAGYKNKGDEWLVLSLNRLLCVRFRLPLYRGGWRPKKLPELARWVETGEAADPPELMS